MTLKIYTCLVLLLIGFTGLAADTDKKKDISYVNDHDERHQLDVYYKKGDTGNKDVIIFIHGGSWNSGRKNTYWWLGRNFAKKGVVAVIINYSLSPYYQYPQMADDCAMAVAWATKNIASYGGNPKRIFIMGHSAGAHLCALINQDPVYFKNAGLVANPVKGVILDDPFSLDIYDYLKNIAPPDSVTAGFKKVFTNNPQEWKKGSPSYYMNGVHNPYLIFNGEKTYPAILSQSKKFVDELHEQKKKAQLIVIKGKSHVPMILQMIFAHNQLYGDILSFLKNTQPFH